MARQSGFLFHHLILSKLSKDSLLFVGTSLKSKDVMRQGRRAREQIHSTNSQVFMRGAEMKRKGVFFESITLTLLSNTLHSHSIFTITSHKNSFFSSLPLSLSSLFPPTLSYFFSASWCLFNGGLNGV